MAEAAELVQEFQGVIAAAVTQRQQLYLDMGMIAFSQKQEGEALRHSFQIGGIAIDTNRLVGNFVLSSFTNKPEELQRTLWTPSRLFGQITSHRILSDTEELRLAIDLVRSPHLHNDALKELKKMSEPEADARRQQYETAVAIISRIKADAKARDRRIVQRNRRRK